MNNTARPADRKLSTSGSQFKKVLQAFANGDLPYSDVQAHLHRLLNSGASPEELRDVLQHYQSIEPLPAHGHEQILRNLNEAIGAAAPNVDSDPAGSQPQDTESAAATVPAAVQDARPSERSPEPIAAVVEARVLSSAAVSAAVAVPRPAARTTAASVEAPVATAENVSSIEDRIARQKADYKALNHAYERVRDAGSAASARSLALAAELAAIRGALESEQEKTRAADEALAESIASGEAARARGDEARRELERVQKELRSLRDLLAARDATVDQLRLSLGEREDQVAALQRDHATRMTAMDVRASVGTRLEADLQAERARSGALGAELAHARTALESHQRESSVLRSSLATLRAHATALAAELASTRAALELEQSKSLETREAHEITVAIDPPRERAAARPVEPQIAAPPWEPAPAATTVRIDPGETAPSSVLKSNRAAQFSEFPLFGSRGRGRAAAVVRFAWVSTALAILAVVVWLFVHHAPVSENASTVPAATPKPGSVIRDCPTCPAMTIVPVGRFKQGSNRADGSAATFERPPHWVLIGRPFAVSTNAVTVDEFRPFIAATGRDMRGCDTYEDRWRIRPDASWENPGFIQTGSHPVTCVSWEDAKAYAGWLSKTTGHRYRLPSAAEWEYAARAGSEAVRPWNPDGSGACASANVADQRAARRYPGWTVFPCDDGYVYTAPVGSFKTNSFGLNDMLGNVFQWTDDCWHADYAGVPTDGSSRTYGDCSERELRGGSWFTTPEFVRASYRNHFGVNYRASTVGIRLVRDVAP